MSLNLHKIVDDLTNLYEQGYNDATLVSKLREHLLPIMDALNQAERFIVGFEDDELQEGIPPLLASIRRAHDQLLH